MCNDTSHSERKKRRLRAPPLYVSSTRAFVRWSSLSPKMLREVAMYIRGHSNRRTVRNGTWMTRQSFTMSRCHANGMPRIMVTTSQSASVGPRSSARRERDAATWLHVLNRKRMHARARVAAAVRRPSPSSSLALIDDMVCDVTTSWLLSNARSLPRVRCISFSDRCTLLCTSTPFREYLWTFIPWGIGEFLYYIFLLLEKLNATVLKLSSRDNFIIYSDKARSQAENGFWVFCYTSFVDRVPVEI